MEKEKTQKFRFWAFFCYKDSLKELAEGTDLEPRQYLEKVLTKTYGDFLISPEHDPDEDQDMAHYHVIYKHPGPCRLDVVRSFVPSGIAYNDFFLGLHHPRNYQRYLLHLDNPEKQQFDGKEDLIVVNNFPLDLSKDLTQTEKFELQQGIEDLIIEFELYDYGYVVDYLRKNKMIDAYIYLTTHTHHFSKYCDSKRHIQKGEQELAERIAKEYENEQ